MQMMKMPASLLCFMSFYRVDKRRLIFLHANINSCVYYGNFRNLTCVWMYFSNTKHTVQNKSQSKFFQTRYTVISFLTTKSKQFCHVCMMHDSSSDQLVEIPALQQYTSYSNRLITALLSSPFMPLKPIRKIMSTC